MRRAWLLCARPSWLTILHIQDLDLDSSVVPALTLLSKGKHNCSKNVKRCRDGSAKKQILDVEMAVCRQDMLYKD